MAQILKGKPVADALDAATMKKAEELKAKGITPTLAILRVGERPDDLSYERGAMKRCEKVGAAVRNVVLPANVSQSGLMDTIRALNEDPLVHGILMFQPLPKGLDAKAATGAIAPGKDVDGAAPGSYAAIYAGTCAGTDVGTGTGVQTGSDAPRRNPSVPAGFAPCTAQAVIEMLQFYGIATEGKRAAVVGRSLVIGKPVAMLLMARNATVTVCHSRTADMPSATKEADIVVAALGKAEFLGADYFREGQTVIDVGINYSEEKQKLVGDVRFDEAEPLVSAISPVPAGVGSVTTAVLVSHVVEAAMAGRR